jgi:hypothetical protein
MVSIGSARAFGLLCRATSCFVSYDPGAACAEPRAGPSVLLITVDTLRADHLGAYGLGLPASPQIDRARRRGRAVRARDRGLERDCAVARDDPHLALPREHSIGFRNGATRLDGVPTLAAAFRERRLSRPRRS